MKLMKKLMKKIILKGKIETLTGLHIGGADNSLDIGGIDNAVLKDAMGRPYIPGSSLKGKMRSLIERAEGLNDLANGKNGGDDIAKVFGAHKQTDGEILEKLGPTRLYVRDAYLEDETASDMDNKRGYFEELEFDYTESKWENTIDRKTSKASNPRITERVPKGAKFDFELVFNIYDTMDEILFDTVVRKCMKMLEDDYLGGNGSRGYGKIHFIDLKKIEKDMSVYEGKEEEKKEDNFVL